MAEMSEAQWQRRITDLCDWKKVLWFHSGDSRRDSCAGFPDLVLVGTRGVAFAELKRHKGRITSEQSRWHTRLQVAGAQVHVWRPEDWEEVQHVIGQIA